jgi:dolichol-phosphate mannosyltransferase
MATARKEKLRPSRFAALDRHQESTGPDWKRIARFLVVGASGVPVNLATVYAATNYLPFPSGMAHGWRDFIAYVCGIVVSIMTNFILHRSWTWKDRVIYTGPTGFIRRMGKFYVVSGVAASIQLLVSSLLSLWMEGSLLFSTPIHDEYRLYHIVAPLVGISFGLVINFAGNNLWTFRKLGDPA